MARGPPTFPSWSSSRGYLVFIVCDGNQCESAEGLLPLQSSGYSIVHEEHFGTGTNGFSSREGEGMQPSLRDRNHVATDQVALHWDGNHWSHGNLGRWDGNHAHLTQPRPCSADLKAGSRAHAKGDQLERKSYRTSRWNTRPRHPLELCHQGF